MSEPMWIDCNSVFDVPPANILAARADGDHHVVLRFTSLESHDALTLIEKLSQVLPDFSVFQSSPTLIPATITILRVIARSKIVNNLPAISAAVIDYLHTSRTLVEQLRSNTLADSWQIAEHGMHYRFENSETGQIVEASIEDNVDPIDPYFFSEFVCSTSTHSALAQLIKHKFHDGARILDEFMTSCPA